jgi:flagellar biosynthesis/type III secretory pathway M-ring protein FliF/YscJ
MQIAIVILAFALLAVVLFVVSAPLRAGGTDTGEARSSPERDELEAAREAKYREIRDAELDLRTGKLSRADYESIDGALRAEALEILDRLQALDASDGGKATDGEAAAAHSEADAGEADASEGR